MYELYGGTDYGHDIPQAMYIMAQLSMPGIIEGDVLGWEAQARGWVGSMAEVLARCSQANSASAPHQPL